MSSRRTQWLEDEIAYNEQKELIGAREYKRLTTSPTVADIHEAFEWFASNDSAVTQTIDCLLAPPHVDGRFVQDAFGTLYKEMLMKAFEGMAEGYATMEMERMEQEADRA